MDGIGFFLVCVFLVAIIPCVISLILVRFLPVMRYLPAALVFLFAAFNLLSAPSMSSSGGISGFGGLAQAVALIIGITGLFVAGVTFLFTFLLYRRWKPKTSNAQSVMIYKVSTSSIRGLFFIAMGAWLILRARRKNMTQQVS